MSTWYSVDDEDAQDRVAAAWHDAPLENLEVCGMILTVAQQQVLAYAPAPAADADPADPPINYVYAQLQQAVNLWNAGRVSSDGDLGDGGYTFTPRPLDKTIRSIIRPIDGKPDVY